jgi:hypothetical protein
MVVAYLGELRGVPSYAFTMDYGLLVVGLAETSK